jgi:CheY-like chemotaxis protein
MWNLLANAVKFTPAGGTITVRTRQDGDVVAISVEDSGQGIDPEFLPHVFERFRQADPSPARQAGGLGLGLAIVRYLVEAHGGTIAADSAGRGRGSCFIVQLPRQAPLATPAAAASEPAGMEEARDSVPPVSLRGLRVLVVEDDTDSRELIGLILRTGGAEVSSAASGHEALQILEQERPTVVISDIGMPDMDGYSFIKRLRSLPQSAGGATPAIALTAYTRELDRQQATRAGFQRHLPKPVTSLVLLRAVAELAAGTQPNSAV